LVLRFQDIEVSRNQGFRVIRYLDFKRLFLKFSGFQGIKDLSDQGFEISRNQGFEIFKNQGFRVIRFQRSKFLRFQCFEFSRN
jgi:hypothetical protein